MFIYKVGAYEKWSPGESLTVVMLASQHTILGID